MIGTQVQNPTFFYERALDLLADRFPQGAMERLRANLAAFRSWIAAPAYRASGPKAAVDHILNSAGPAVQLKVDFIGVLADVPDGFALLATIMTMEPGKILPVEQDPALAEAVADLQAGQRTWLRFVTFHPDLAGVEARVGTERLTDVINLCFHADNLLTVCMMGADGSCGSVPPLVHEAIAAAAADYAARYHAAVRDLVESAAPSLDPADPFKATTLQDLLALPPYDGPAASVHEMGDSIGGLFSS